jgi:hypothetical protein
MRHLLIAALLAALPLGGCAQPASSNEETKVTNAPSAATFTSAPLRNRIRVELNAPVPEVWALVGNLARFPEYSSGLERVEPRESAGGELTEYVCHFKPREEGGDRIVHREIFRWYAPDRGWATMSEEPNAFGFMNSLTLVTLDPLPSGSVLTWDQHYDAEDLAMGRAEFDGALADIGENLVRRFGGRVVERFTDAPVNLQGAE